MEYTKDDLREAKRQIDSTLHKLKETITTLKEALIKSPHTSWRQIFRPVSLKNLEIHKVFLRFFASRDKKFPRQSAHVDLISPSLIQRRTQTI